MKPWLEKEGMQQVICVPLLVKRKLVGAFILGARRERPITPEEMSLLGQVEGRSESRLKMHTCTTG